MSESGWVSAPACRRQDHITERERDVVVVMEVIAVAGSRRLRNWGTEAVIVGVAIVMGVAAVAVAGRGE